MCPPDYFDVIYAINPWMDTSVKVNVEEAKKEWSCLVEIYKGFNIQVELLPAQKNLPDMVFSANGSFAIGDTALISSYRYKERQPEAQFHRSWFKEHGFDIQETDGITYEGEGDSLLVGQNILQGWGFRSDQEIKNVLIAVFPDYKVKMLHLIDERFYHLDTCLFPVNSKLIFYYKPAFDSASIKLLNRIFTNAIAVTDKEALSFGLNSIIVGENVVLPAHAVKFAERIKSHGFHVIKAKMGEFGKSGGAVKCVTNEIW